MKNTKKIISMLSVIAFLALSAAVAGSAENQWTGILPERSKGAPIVKLPSGIESTAVVALPERERDSLSAITKESQPAGIYEIRITARPSHVAGAIAFHSGLRVHVANALAAHFPGYFFARAHEPEPRVFSAVLPGGAPIAVMLEAYSDSDIVDAVRTASLMKRGGPRMTDGLDDTHDADLKLADELEFRPTSENAVYYLVDRIEFRPVSRSGGVAAVATDKVRYEPGSVLRGNAEIEDVGGKGGTGNLNIYLEHGVKERDPVKTLPVTLTGERQIFEFEIPLPRDELGYALVAEFVSADGSDRHEAVEYFTIAENPYRVAIFNVNAGGDDVQGGGDEDAMTRWVESLRRSYVNVVEWFAWAEEDMVELSSDTDHWFSGQTCYAKSRDVLQRRIRLLHENGIAAVTYGKFHMSGYLGWKTAWDYPLDHGAQWHYHIGMYSRTDVPVLDRFRNKEFQLENGPMVAGANPFRASWQSFLPISPDPEPWPVRLAAEEMIRSIEMFGWDGVRWDGHPRAFGWGTSGQGRDGKYSQDVHRRTQALVRYFKDIVALRYPDFRHGYNYLLPNPAKPNYDWAVEDYELDELCRDGGLLMNESIGNAIPGPFSLIARHLQVEGDLCRERGGHYQGVQFGNGMRDALVEFALWAAAGAHPYGASETSGPYLTRYSRYVFDERLRRLATPEKVLAPAAETRLWWRPFVYETPEADGRRQLVVNFLNLPLQESRNSRENPKVSFVMEPGTDPVTFALTLPRGFRATAAHIIDPWSLEVSPMPLADNCFEVPAIAVWRVGVIDIESAPDAPSLASLYGPPATFGVTRPDVEKRIPDIRLDPLADLEAAERVLAAAPSWLSRRPGPEEKAVDALSWTERNARILEIRSKNPPEIFINTWWKGARLPDDLKLKETKFDFGDLAPRRNGRLDVFHGRGAMDERLRFSEAWAGFDRFFVHDAPLVGAVTASPGMGLVNNISRSRFPDFDLLLFAGIPHCAIGVENSYAMVEYVKAGGAAFFTGGEYAFGKGGCMHTVLDRELLPVWSCERVDTRYSEIPLPFEPAADFSELGVDLDFADKPSFWVWNQVALKDDAGVKVFLKSGSRPVLVGWQLGKGRVACLLVDHRGKSKNGITAFFDWSDWPKLMQAVANWLAPEAMTKAPVAPSSVSREEIRNLIEQLEGDALVAAIEGIESEDRFDGLMENEPMIASEPDMNWEDQRKRIAVIERLLQGTGPDVSAALVEQIKTVSDLPMKTRFAMLDFVRREPPANLASVARKCLLGRDPAIRNTGLQLLAILGDEAFAGELLDPDPQEVIGILGAFDRDRFLAVGVAMYPKPDLLAEGKRRVDAWNEQELKSKMAYTGGREFSLAAPEAPCLDAETLLQRIAWLGYLARHNPPAWGAQFVREWTLTAQYEELCDRSAAGLWQQGMSARSSAHAAAKSADWRSVRELFARMRDLTRPDMDAMIVNHPEGVAEGLARVRFLSEVRLAINLLGDHGEAGRKVASLMDAPSLQKDLGAFIAACQRE